MSRHKEETAQLYNIKPEKKEQRTLKRNSNHKSSYKVPVNEI